MMMSELLIVEEREWMESGINLSFFCFLLDGDRFVGQS
jgi:hypothetical protein